MIASGPAAAVWFVSECVLLLALRVFVNGEWRCPKAGADGVGISLFVHFGCFVVVFAIPIPAMKLPFFLGPPVWLSFVAYSLLISNPLMLYAAYRLDRDDHFRAGELEAWVGLAVGVVVALVGAAVCWGSMNEEYQRGEGVGTGGASADLISTAH